MTDHDLRRLQAVCLLLTSCEMEFFCNFCFMGTRVWRKEWRERRYETDLLFVLFTATAVIL